MAFLVRRGAEVVSLSCNRPTHWNNSQCTPFLRGVSNKILIHLCWDVAHAVLELLQTGV